MKTKRYLNVLYENQAAEIDTEGMEDFYQVQSKIARTFKGFPAGYPRVQLWNKNTRPQIQIDDFDDIMALPKEYFVEGNGLSLTVKVAPNLPRAPKKVSEFWNALWNISDPLDGNSIVQLQDGAFLLDDWIFFLHPSLLS